MLQINKRVVDAAKKNNELVESIHKKLFSNKLGHVAEAERFENIFKPMVNTYQGNCVNFNQRMTQTIS